MEIKDKEILVVIVTYNAMKWAKKCFDSLLHSSIPVDVFIVDNHSSDGTCEFIKQNYPQFTLFDSNVNLKFGRGNNVGLKYALQHHYSYVYLLNQDAWIYPDTLSILVNQSKQNPDYGVLSPLQLKKGGVFFNQTFHDWACNDRICKHILEDALLNNVKPIYETNFVMAAHWLLTRSCLEKVGGFSPSFEHRGEDNNYIERVRFYGLKVGIVPSSLAIHDSETLKRDESIYMNYQNLVQQISSPQGVNWKLIFRTMLTTIHFVFIYKSFTPLKNILLFFKHKKVYDYHRVQSQQGAAFL